MATGTLNAIDYSYGPPDYVQAVRSGVRLFCRYLSPSSGKDFTPAEIKTIHGLGAAALALWEGYADDAKKGNPEGRANGLAALGKLSALQQGVGYTPKNRPGVAFAVDYDVQPYDYHLIGDYFSGIRTSVGDKIRIGCYGHAKIIDYLTGLHLIDFGFQTYAWSYGVISPNADLYQFLNGQTRWGGEVDYCQINNLSALGAWFAPNSPFNTDSTGGTVSANGPEHWDSKDFAVLDKHIADQLIDMLHYLGGSGNNGGDSGAFTAKDLEPLGGVLYRLATRTVPKNPPAK
jgi:hypothetical protein